MSTSVAMGLVPSGKPHPAMKWTLLVALLVVVGLGVPKAAVASMPTVKAPTGPSSGGVFTGPYTFETYIYCDSGVTFNSSYTNGLEGTHTFTFQGAPDGSLLVSIDGGGQQLITSCGNPFAPTATTVATYTVTKNSSPPSPTPSATPPPTPTPTPNPTANPAPVGGTTTGGSGSNGGSHPASGGASQSTNTTSVNQTTTEPSTPVDGQPAPVIQPTTPPVRQPVNRKTLSPQTTPHKAKPASSTPPQHVLSWRSIASATLLLALIVAVIVGLRTAAVRQWLGVSWVRLKLRLGPVRFRLLWLLRRLGHGRAHDEARGRGLSPHKHTGRLLAHHHTSYPALGFLVLVSTVLLAAYSYSSHADSSMLSLTVQGPPPTAAATIDVPTDGTRQTTSTLTVRGTCPAGLLIEIYRNGSFAGSTLCDDTGLYNILISLVDGHNDLIARDADGLGQYGPNSTTVGVEYDAPPAPTPLPTPSSAPVASTEPSPTNPATTRAPSATTSPTPRLSTKPSVTPPLVIDVQHHYYQGINPGDGFTWPMTITGGVGPYRVTVDWGDGKTDHLSLAAPGALAPQHSYRNGGTYHVIVRAKDAVGREAVLSLVAIVSGQPQVAVSTSGQDKGGTLLMAWPMLATTGLLVLSFWLGEHHKLALAQLQAQPAA